MVRFLSDYIPWNPSNRPPIAPLVENSNPESLQQRVNQHGRYLDADADAVGAFAVLSRLVCVNQAVSLPGKLASLPVIGLRELYTPRVLHIFAPGKSGAAISLARRVTVFSVAASRVQGKSKSSGDSRERIRNDSSLKIRLGWILGWRSVLGARSIPSLQTVEPPFYEPRRI